MQAHAAVHKLHLPRCRFHVLRCVHHCAEQLACAAVAVAVIERFSLCRLLRLLLHLLHLLCCPSMTCRVALPAVHPASADVGSLARGGSLTLAVSHHTTPCPAPAALRRPLPSSALQPGCRRLRLHARRSSLSAAGRMAAVAPLSRSGGPSIGTGAGDDFSARHRKKPAFSGTNAAIRGGFYPCASCRMRSCAAALRWSYSSWTIRSTAALWLSGFG